MFAAVLQPTLFFFFSGRWRWVGTFSFNCPSPRETLLGRREKPDAFPLPPPTPLHYHPLRSPPPSARTQHISSPRKKRIQFHFLLFPFHSPALSVGRSFLPGLNTNEGYYRVLWHGVHIFEAVFVKTKKNTIVYENKCIEKANICHLFLVQNCW